MQLAIGCTVVTQYALPIKFTSFEIQKQIRRSLSNTSTTVEIQMTNTNSDASDD